FNAQSKTTRTVELASLCDLIIAETLEKVVITTSKARCFVVRGALVTYHI
ncbi:hypothetical protein Tco_1514248, partial [Tanacetum coccineum]